MILIDDRAGSSSLIRKKALQGISELARLDSGDICFPGNGPDGDVLIGIEYKSMYELMTSADSGRLQATQIPRMMESYDVCYLLYYGEYQPYMGNRADRLGALQVRQGGKWVDYVHHSRGKRVAPYGYLSKLLMTIEAAGLKVQRVNDEKEAAVWIRNAYEWWSKPWRRHSSMRHLHHHGGAAMMPNLPEDVLLRTKIAAQLPGVGYNRALAAARHFPTVGSMLTASEKQWMGIEGIGKGIAKAIREALG